VSYRIGVSQVSEPTSQIMVRVVGMGSPTHNELNKQFKDADGDLLADAPADAAKQLDPAVLKFSYVATENPEEYAKAWAPFVAYLSKVTGKKAEYVSFKDYPAQLKAMKAGQLQVVGLSTGAVPTAVNECGLVPVCTFGSPEGPGGYEMEIIVPATSSMTGPKDLKGHTLTLTDPSSNSGFKAPLMLMTHDLGMELDTDFNIVYSYGHEQSILGVADGHYEAAAVASDIVARMTTQGLVDSHKFKVIYKSERFPPAGLGYVYNLKPELAAKVREAFNSFQWKGTPLADEFAGAGYDRFVAISYKDDWALVRRIDDAFGEQQKVE
jgi:phosphonate transport system substrate-binding protein